jgi:hypothetical protein
MLKENQKAKVKMQNGRATLNKRLKCKRQEYRAKIKTLNFDLSF